MSVKDFFRIPKTKADRQFEFLDERLIDIQGKLKLLSRKVDTMSSNVDRIEKEAADLTEDAVVIKGALGELKTLVVDLKAQVAQGQLDQARLDAAASSLEKVDDDLDALTAPEPTPTEPPA